MPKSFRVLSDQITQRLKEMVTLADDSSGWLNRNLWRMYVNAQTQRWKTEGESENDPWPALSPKYAKYKLKAFKRYPGKGKRMMVATNRLLKSVVGKSSDTRKIVTKRTLRVMTAVEYAEYADEARNFTEFSRKFNRKMRREYLKYLKRRYKGRR